MGNKKPYPFKVSAKQLRESYDLRLAAQFGDRKSKDRLESYNRRMKELRKMDYKQEWIVDGKILNRQKMMVYINALVASGTSLPELCDQRGMPTMQEVYTWFDNHPEFLRDYDRAEEIRAHRMGEKAREIGENTDRENVQADKLKVDVLLRAAARGNKRFQEKQIVEQRDEYASMTPEQIRERVRRMLEADPALNSVATQMLDAAPIEQQALPDSTQDEVDLHGEPARQADSSSASYSH
jgi:hypothetical protein